jgi:hypothetical protein
VKSCREGDGVRKANGNSDGRPIDADPRRADISEEGYWNANLWNAEVGKKAVQVDGKTESKRIVEIAVYNLDNVGGNQVDSAT